MKYEYYKDKYKTISIKLDKEKDAPVIKYFEDLAAKGTGAKHAICWLVARELKTQHIIKNVFNDLFKIEEVEPPCQKSSSLSK